MTRTRAGKVSADKLFADKLFDCCWVELDGFQRPQLVVQMRMKPPVYAIGPGLYDESGRAMPTHPDAPRVLLIYNTTISPRRMLA